MSDHKDDTITEENTPPKVVPQITTVTNISAKFPYLKNAKSMTTDNDGNLKIRPPVYLECHKARFGENAEPEKMQKSLLKQKFEEFRIFKEEGLDKGYDKMQKILTQMNTLKIKPEPEDVNMKFLRGLPPSWTGIALILKTKVGLKYISFDDLYNKLKFLEINTKGYSSSSSTLSNAAFVSTAGSSQGNLSYQESGDGGYTTTLSVSPGYSSSKGSSKSKCSVVDDVIYSFFANHEIDQHLVYEDLDQMNKDEFEMEMLSIKLHIFKKKHERKIKFNGRENARKDGSDSKVMVVVDGSIDWDKKTEEGNTDPRSLENFGMVAGIKIESDVDSEGKVVSADDAIPAGLSVSAGDVAAAVVSPQSETEFALMGLSTELAYEEKIRVLSYKLEEKSNILEYRQKLIDQAAQETQELMTKLDNEIANQAKWNNSGKNLYKLIDSSMFVSTKRGLGLDKYIGEGELGIDDCKFSIFHTNSDELKRQPIYNRFALVDHIKAVPPPLIGNYMPPSNIPDIYESQMVYGKKATDSSKIKTNDDSISHSNDSVLFNFSDRSSEPSTNDFQTCDTSVECLRPNHSDHDSTDFVSSISAPASESRDTIVIDCDRQEDFPSVCTSSIEIDVKSSKTFYLHLIKDCDLHEQRLAKRNAEGKGILGRRPIGKPVNPNKPKPVSAGQQNLVSTVSAGEATLACNIIPLSVSAGYGILGPRSLNIQPKSTNFHSFTHNNQQIIFPMTHNSLYSLYMTGGLNGKTAVKPSAGWPWTKYGMSKTKGSKINGGSKSKSWSYVKGPLGRPKLEKAKDRGIVDSGCSQSMSGNKDKLEDFEDFDGGEHFNLISVSQICDQTHRVLFTKHECLVLSKDFPLPDPSMVILSIPRKHNLYTFSLNELAPKGPLTCLIAKASQNESILWHMRLGHVNFKNINKLVKGNLVRGLRGFDGTIAMPELHNKMEVLVSKPHDKTPYELLTVYKPSISYLKPFGCHVTILNTSDPLGKFDTKSDEGYIVGVSSTNLTACSQGATLSNAVVPIVDEATTQNDGTKFDHATPNADNLDELAELQALQRQEKARKEEADRLGLEFPSLNLILGIGTAFIGSSISTGSTPPVSTGSTPLMSPCASPIFADQHFISVGKSHVSVGRPTGSAGRPVFASRPSSSANRTPVPAGHILGKFTALADPDWVEAMYAEMQQFRNQKARLVAQGHRQEERINYTDVFAPVARIKVIRLFLAFASFMGFMVYQMDMKSAFLYGKIAEEVYVTQPRGFEDPYHPKKVYKVVKALYRLHQAPRAWYERLSTFLLKHGYRRGTIDKTLFIKKDSKDIMLVQVYADDIIFSSTRKDWCEEFET
nr:putative ribonuclease H-like domain-containing protein [Tanacetum cinerariifolium]